MQDRPTGSWTTAPAIAIIDPGYYNCLLLCSIAVIVGLEARSDKSSKASKIEFSTVISENISSLKRDLLRSNVTVKLDGKSVVVKRTGARRAFNVPILLPLLAIAVLFGVSC